jgi:hypothetical protein
LDETTGGKKKKKYYSKRGDLITDPTLIMDVQRVFTVYKYHEEKSGKEKCYH